MYHCGSLGSYAIALCAIVPSWGFRGSKIFSRAYFVILNFFSGVFRGSKIFFVGILCFQYFFSWLFCWSEFFSLGYFVGLKLFLVGISCVQFFFMANFMIQRFSVAGCMKNNDGEQKYRNTSQTRILFLLNFNSCQLFILEKCFIY